MSKMAELAAQKEYEQLTERDKEELDMIGIEDRADRQRQDNVSPVIDAEAVQLSPLDIALKVKRDPYWALAEIRDEIREIRTMRRNGVYDDADMTACLNRIYTLTGAL